MIKLNIIITSLVLSLGLSGVAMAKNDKEKKLPPGLQKKVKSGKPLPPGWQKKLVVGEVLEQEVYDQGRVLIKEQDKGLVTIRVEGKLIRVMENTREIVEIFKAL